MYLWNMIFYWIIENFQYSYFLQIFDGNYDKNTAVVNMFAVPFRAIQIRIHPTACYNHPCVRLEIYGCPGNEPKGTMHLINQTKAS